MINSYIPEILRSIVASKWEQQVLGGLALLIIAVVVGVFGNQLPDDYKAFAWLSVPIGLVGIGFMYFGAKTKWNSLP